MKKFKNSISMLCILGFILASCGKNHQKQLAKTWQVSNVETSTALPDSVKAQMLAGSEMSFTSDGHYTSSGGIGADRGTYTLDKEGKNLSTISEAGKSNSVYTIEKLSDDELILKNNGNTLTCIAKK